MSDQERGLTADPQDARVATMTRLTALRLTADGRLLGFDTGDWSMLLGGFFLAGLLALLV
jgi:hypothetical protein